MSAEPNISSFLRDCNVDTLKHMASKLGINTKEYKKKAELMNMIEGVFLNQHNHNSPSKPKKEKAVMKPIGEGKDGKTYSKKVKGTPTTAVKQFRKTKSPVKITSEAEFQKMASDRGISPKIIRYDLDGKKIEMEKLDRTLYDILKATNGKLTQKYQRRIIEIFKVLDELKIFHADPNVLNFMEKDKQLYIIDFGFAKKITPRLASKHGTEKLNMEFMPVGLYIKLKQLCPAGEFDIIKQAIPEGKKYIIDQSKDFKIPQM